ncbi:hypothetical protein KAR91_34685 [Candidatus Pacearchaeota archaeon]|nr:hypothetical protein [Candidatus Pacearchaeota archaeon]
MAFEELFVIYPNKNVELRACAKVAYEFGRNIAKEPSAGASMGINEHAVVRQEGYLDRMEDMVDAIFERPVPDMPYIHATRFDCDLSDPYEQFAVDGLALNEDTQMLAQYWMIVAVELAASQSAGIAGGLFEADYKRVKNHIKVIEQYVEEVAKRPIPDVPETAFPGALLEVPGKKNK